MCRVYNVIFRNTFSKLQIYQVADFMGYVLLRCNVLFWSGMVLAVPNSRVVV